MKFPLCALAAAVTAASAVPAASAASSPTFAFSSSFASRGAASTSPSTRRGRGIPTRRDYRRGDATMYEPGSDGEDRKNVPKVDDAASSTVVGVWSALADTERWITETLDEAAGSEGRYSRKAVTYVCETSDSLPHAVGSVWRRIKEARELGEAHGKEEEARRAREGPEAYVPRTFRQTQVVVLPNCPDIVPVLGAKDRGKGAKSFKVFDGVLKAVGRARRNARDLLTDSSLDKLEERMMGEGMLDWSVSVNVAHLHPYYGEKTPEEVLAEMQEAEESGEPEVVDVNLEAYKELRTKARRSPHPSLVLEVMASPPPDFGGEAAQQQPPSPEMEARARSVEEAMGSSKRGRGRDGDEGVSSVDVQRLEVLFGMGAATDRADPSAVAATEDEGESTEDGEEEDFWAALSNVKGIEEISSVTNLNLSRRWAAANDPLYSSDTASSSCVFLEADADVVDVDAAYEFIFLSAGGEMASITAESDVAEDGEPSKRRRTYLALPHFLTNSATSFEKFAAEVMNIARSVPGLYDGDKGKLEDVSFFHPEDVEEGRRSPVPLLVLQWK
uniref:Uncharacterized protein n=1 Tax=Odontella aurita TaxID=265563 RepID=A0A7S4M9D6_9STRA|mmetsp:Transcript_15296/g.44409  ORF Transcript_15296/g.44409 Transcript_15296/m.44409 type:complete len:559 (+) Transcript_15296:198-1874(+)